MDRFDPFVKYADVYGDIINWEKDPMNKPQNQNKYFFSDGKTYYEQICKMLRLMSVFKEAFNQIYSNEDEISEAWENFVNNLSASVVEGSEPDVTLTWTDDSVNFEFTMVPGVPGEQGVGITSISFNSDYTMTITLSDGNTYTSMSLKGETGPQGPQGETGSGLQILDVYATLADLQSAHPTGQPGDAYQVGSEGSYTLYIWSSSQSAWVNAGSLGTVSPSVSNPLMDGTASAGSLDQYSRGDHVHPTDTSRASKEELDALIKTSQSLIDQSFTYRESPAIQDGLARIDKIKGNTLRWNQLLEPSVTRTYQGIDITNNGDGSVTLNGTYTGGQTGNLFISSNTFSVIAGHWYLTDFSNSNADWTIRVNNDTGIGTLINGATIQTPQRDKTGGLDIRIPVGATYENMKLYPKCYDLTVMFGADIAQQMRDMEVAEPGSGVAYFRSLFPSSYYGYNAGSLLSFNGTGLKITGKNLNPWQGVDYSAVTDRTIFLKKGDYVLSTDNGNAILYNNLIYLCLVDNNGNNATEGGITSQYLYLNTAKTLYYGGGDRNNVPFTLNRDSYVSFGFNNQKPTNFNALQLEYGSVSSEYEPYKESTLLLPISTYFPTGMKSAGIAYDELTPTKAITRIGSREYQTGDESDTNVITDGTTTYYPLTTPTETAVDLDLDFMAYEDGTEQLLPVNGSVPSTSPIIADMTYLSIDEAMEYVLEKLNNVPQNTQQILESLEDDVADLQTDVGALQPAVSSLQTSVGNINTNIGQISSTVAGHTASISDMQSDITDLNTGLSDLGDTVTDNTSRIGTLETGLSDTNGDVQDLETSVSGLDSTVTAQGETVTALDNIIQDISNNPVVASLGSHELGFVAAYVSATLAANTGTKVTIPKPTIFPNNYTPLFIVGMTTGSYNVSICEIPYSFGNRDSVDCRVWNHGGQQTTQITVYILCMRQRQSQ